MGNRFVFRVIATGCLLALAVSSFTACGSSDGDDGPKACLWPAQFTQGADPAPGACHAAHHYVLCDRGFVADTCLTEELTCPDTQGFGGTCANKCNDGEYGMECGAAGVAPVPQPPTTCRILPYTIQDKVVACCPCGA